ncbi:hypothetical protein WDW89_24420 [Deltaproteobacteria bacterium TL4]
MNWTRNWRLAAIEAHIRRRLRSQLVGEQKQRRNLFRRLLERGVNRASSTKVFQKHRGRWFLSHLQAVEKAWNNE